MTTGRATVLVAGVSARALARSALAAGWNVVAVDGFGDRDLVEHQPQSLRHVLAHPFRPALAARLGAGLRADAVAYASNFENFPAALATLAAGRELWGNAPSVLRRVRRAESMTAALRTADLPAPRLGHESPDRVGTRWLVKPRRGGGGRGIRVWTPGDRVRRSEYLQECIDGTPGSLVFLADGRDIVPLALTRQLVGDPRLGGWGYCYVGSQLASRRHPLFEAQETVMAGAVRAAAALTRAFGLVGFNTVDFMARDGATWPVELNPRHSASVELIERELGASLFGAHVEAVHGALPRTPHDPLGWDTVPGKAVLYARRRFIMSGSDALLGAADVADITPDGAVVPAGAPVCTVFARGTSHDDCLAALVRRGAAILPQLRSEHEAA
ncbi:MAG TPA: ATP-grasp domain-containing protein [Gemmatimonadales bacterium]|nr:ATP-grasp domain-containing protein [Gemmatimonadales bacterium]